MSVWVIRNRNGDYWKPTSREKWVTNLCDAKFYGRIGLAKTAQKGENCGVYKTVLVEYQLIELA